MPTAITFLAAQAGHTAMEGARLASYGTALLSIGTILGALIVPLLADSLGRKLNQVIFFAIMGAFIWLAFGHVFYQNKGALEWFLVCVFFLGVEAQTSRPIPSGYLNSTGPSVARAPWLLFAMWDGLRRRALHFW